MEDSEVIQLLRYYRHNVLNQLQLIQGYVSMNKPDIAKEKLGEYNTYLQKEQKLMDVKAPSFTIWLLFFNDTHPTIRMTYDVGIKEMNLTDVDTFLTAQCEKMFDSLYDHLPKTEYYEGHFELQMARNDTLLIVNIDLSGDFSAIGRKELKQLQEISQFKIDKTMKGMQCSYLLSLHNEVD